MGHLGPSWDHLGSSWVVLSRLRATLGPLGERIRDGIADFAKFAPRLHETPILGSSWGRFGSILGSFWGHLGAISGHLGHLGAVLGHFGAISGSYHVHLAPFQVYDFGRWMVHSRLCKIRTSPRRDANFGGSWLRLGSILGPSSGHLGPSWAHLGPSWAVLSRLRATLGPLGE